MDHGDANYADDRARDDVPRDTLAEAARLREKPRTHDPDAAPHIAPIGGALEEVLREAEILENLVGSLVDRIGPVLDLESDGPGIPVDGEISTGVHLADVLRRHARHLDGISDRVRFALDRLAL